MPYSQPSLGGIRIPQYAVPTTGQTVAANSATTALILQPAGLLAALTVTMPSSPMDGQVLSIPSTAAVTVLTLNGATINAPLTAFVANGFGEWIWSVSGNAWYRIG